MFATFQHTQVVTLKNLIFLIIPFYVSDDCEQKKSGHGHHARNLQKAELINLIGKDAFVKQGERSS